MKLYLNVDVWLLFPLTISTGFELTFIWSVITLKLIFNLVYNISTKKGHHFNKKITTYCSGISIKMSSKLNFDVGNFDSIVM